MDIEALRNRFPAGTRIVLDYMPDDPRPIPPGTKGTVEHVDDIGTVFVNFDNGRHLGVVPGVDSFHCITEKGREER